MIEFKNMKLESDINLESDIEVITTEPEINNELDEIEKNDKSPSNRNVEDDLDVDYEGSAAVDNSNHDTSPTPPVAGIFSFFYYFLLYFIYLYCALVQLTDDHIKNRFQYSKCISFNECCYVMKICAFFPCRMCVKRIHM